MGWCSDHGLPHSHLLGWDPEDRAKLIAHLMETASRCQLCGTSPWEWEQDRYAYEAGLELCQGCLVKAAASEDDHPAGTRVVLTPRRTAAAGRSRRHPLPGEG